MILNGRMLSEAQPSFSSFAWIIQYQTPIENSRYATAFRNGRTILSFQMVRDDACHWRLPGEASSLPSSYQSIIVRDPCAVPNHSNATMLFWIAEPFSSMSWIYDVSPVGARPTLQAHTGLRHLYDSYHQTHIEMHYGYRKGYLQTISKLLANNVRIISKQQN